MPGTGRPGGFVGESGAALPRRLRDPAVLVGRAMMAFIFVVEGLEKIAGYAGVASYMEQHGVAASLLPLVILTELGGGLLVLAGWKAGWAALALSGFCLLTAVVFHLPAGETIEVQKNVAMAGGFLLLAAFGPGRWSIDHWRGRA